MAKGTFRTAWRAAILGGTASLAGCGGGGGGSVASAPPPVSTGPTYTTLASATASTPLVSRAVVAAREDVRTANSNGTRSALRAVPIDISYDVASGTYTVRGVPAGGAAAIEQRFGPADLDANGGYTKPASGAAPAGSLRIATNTSFTYASLARWVTSDGAGRTDTTLFAFGIPTQASDMPRTGSATYALQFAVDPYDPPQEINGSLRADFASATVNVTIAPLFRYRPFPEQGNDPYTTLTGSGAISAASFSAQLTSDNDYGASITGAFYGPQAAELGGAYIITKNGVNFITGAVLGRKN